jgi:hypothetical protein
MTLCDKQHKRELCDKSLKLADKMIASYESSISLYAGSRHPELVDHIPEAREQLAIWLYIKDALAQQKGTPHDVQ